MARDKTAKASGGSGIFFVLIAFILGFFEYGQSIAGGLAVVLLSVVEALAALVGLIPVGGPFLYYFFTGNWGLAWTLSFTGLVGTWVTSLVFWIGLLFSVALTFVGPFFLAMRIRHKMVAQAI